MLGSRIRLAGPIRLAQDVGISNEKICGAQAGPIGPMSKEKGVCEDSVEIVLRREGSPI
jgi:hypothetical protein